MKRSIIILIQLLCLGSLFSCQTVTKLGRKPTAVAPFVKFKDGTVVQAKEVNMMSGLGDNVVIADGKPYPQRDVVQISNGKQTLGKIEGSFCPMIAEGRISVYSNSDARKFGYGPETILYKPGGGYIVGNGEKLYVQDSAGGKIRLLRYKSVKKLVPINTPAYPLLRQYKRTRLVGSLAMLGGLGCFVGGTVIASNGILQDKSDKRINTGVAMLFGGIGIMGGTTITLFTQKYKVDKIIAIQNGMSGD